MAEEDRKLEAEAASADDELEFDIERDGRFISIAADSVYAFDRGSDTTLSLVEEGPRPVAVRPPRGRVASDEDGIARGGLAWQGSYTEIARVRIDHSTAVLVAMQLLDQSLAGGRIKADIFRRTIDEMIARHATADSPSDAHEPTSGEA